MKVEVAKLKEACEQVISRADAKEAGRLDAWKEYSAAKEAKWLEENLPKVREYRDAITKALKTGKVISKKDLPHSPFYDPTYAQFSKNYFTWDGITYHPIDRQYANNARHLLSLVEVIADKTVTLTELRRLGFDVRYLMDVLGVDEGKY